MIITARFFNLPGSVHDEKIREIFRKYGGHTRGSGMHVLFGAYAGQRDLEYSVPNKNAAKCKAALRRAKIKVD